MKIIKTKSFELSTFSRGDENSERMAILLPGRLDTKDYGNFVSHADYLASQGFYVIAMDPPGIWESPGGIDIYNTTNYIKAVNELIEYFGNRPTLLLGHSRGAAVAIYVSISNPHVIGIISVMANYGVPTPPTQESIKKGFQISYRDLPPGTTKTKGQKEFSLPLSYWEDGEKYNAGETFKKCTQPKLIIYGYDEHTPINEVTELYQYLSEPKMIKMVDSAHDYRYYPQAIKDVEKEIDLFLEKYF